MRSLKISSTGNNILKIKKLKVKLLNVLKELKARYYLLTAVSVPPCHVPITDKKDIVFCILITHLFHVL